MSTPRKPLRCLGCLLLSYTLLSLAAPAWSQVGASSSPDNPSGMSEWLQAAADDPAPAASQRELMTGLAVRGLGPDALPFPLSGQPAELGLAGVGAPMSKTGNPADGLWTQVEPPVWRCWHSAVHDPVRDRMIVFGGYDGFDVHNDVWAFEPDGDREWRQLHPAGTPPSPRATHAAVYDPLRDRMLVFGGGWFDGSAWHFDNHDLWALSLGGTPAWTLLSPTGPTPATSGHATMVYDPSGDRVVMFGGTDGTSKFNDVWELSLSGTPAWTQLAPSGTPPDPRTQHSALYDGGRGQMIVFGGHQGAIYYNDVWVLSLGDTPGWTKLSPSGTAPAVRSGHAAVLDAAHDRMIVWGGADASAYFDDCWSLTLGESPAWTMIMQVGLAPPAVSGHTGVYDPDHGCMRVFGGWGGHPSTVYTHVWNLAMTDPPVWTAPVTCPGPNATGRSAHSAVYDPLGRRMIVFGGANSWVPVGVTYFNDVWAINLTSHPTWTQISATGTPPAARMYHSAIFDPVRNRMIVFGGYSAVGSYNDTWELTLSGVPAWHQLAPTGTPPAIRYAHSAIYDPAADRMLVFGGYSAGTYLNDLWSLSLSGTPAWTQLAAGSPPAARNGHTAIHDPVGNRMLVFGGYSTLGYYNDVWQLSLAGAPAWSQLAPSGTLPAGRRRHAAAYDSQRQRMLVSGGRLSSTAVTTELWAFDLAGTPAWTLLDPMWPPTTGLVAHKAIYDPDFDRLVMYSAGFNGDNSLWLMYPAAQLGIPLSPGRPGLALGPTAPNPSRGETAVLFSLDREVRATLRVVDIGGRVVRTLVDGFLPQGSHRARWDGKTSDGTRARPGVYFLDLRAGGDRLSRRLVLMR